MASRQPFSFRGIGFSLRGEKDRFVLPPAFRKLVKDASGGAKTLCLAKHDRWNCLTGFGLSRLDEIPAQLDREQDYALARNQDFDRDLRKQQLYGFQEASFDDSGRFVLPEFVATLGNIEDQAFFNGAGDFFTIWNPAELAKMGAGWEQAQASCAALAADAASSSRGRK